MLSDRPYMRETHARPPLPALTWLICAIAGGFVVENIFLRWFNADVGAAFFRTLSLSPEGINQGFVWSLFTHGLLHDPNGLLHLVLVLLTLFFFGRAVTAEIGPKRLLVVFVVSIVAGGFAWLAVNWTHGGRLFGASSGVGALIVLFACLAPERPIRLFLLDIGMRAKHIAVGLLIIHALGLLLVEIPGRNSWFAMAHSAQLGGMLIGWVYFRFFLSAPPPARSSEKPDIELPDWLRKTRRADTSPPAYKVDVTPVEDMRVEIDRILDKINSDGFQSLTAAEKLRLDHAREHLSRR